MKLKLASLAVAVTAATSITHTEPAQARAGTLISCEGISTQQGFKYVGIYCADYQCKYTVTRVFDSYCPFSL